MKLFHLEDVGTNVTEKTIIFLMYRLMFIRGFNLFLVIHFSFLPVAILTIYEGIFTFWVEFVVVYIKLDFGEFFLVSGFLLACHR